MKTVGKCSLLTFLRIKDFRFAVETHPQNLISDHLPFSVIFFWFISIILKTVGNGSLLTVISIKDIRFAVEKPPSKFAVFGHFFSVYLNYFENCWEMFTFNGYKHQGHSICSRKPPSKFVIGAFFRLICRFRSFFFLFISILMKTVGKCSLLTFLRIKDFRFAVETHPQNLISDRYCD
ncbi:hypothetical protein AGLY_017052 [Aphis glycines]|uniref:Uncharacterized protein n=1 Tax=Aphis glycines TaxID=307491 RepID=A0A6G0SVY4_APHGL|nr:hypothetical protein AGLY_017052 [Aphis glycines]